MNDFNFSADQRNQLFQATLDKIEGYYADTAREIVSADWNPEEVKNFTDTLQLESPNEAKTVLEHVVQGLGKYAVHTPHPAYFGLYNPRPVFASIVADLVTAGFNPQLAAWSHAPFANEIEMRLIRELGSKLGLPQTDGTFATGGAEANLTALVTALNHHFPGFGERGLSALGKHPLIYCSDESHHSIEKAAKVTGLGKLAVRSVPTNKRQQMRTDKLGKMIEADLANGYQPFMIVATAGTTGSGAVDDMHTLRKIADSYDLWLHADAAYGGAIGISDKYRSAISGIERVDSITLDLHKWFSVPMGTSVYLTPHTEILHQSFDVHTDYMPEDGDPTEVIDPYLHSVQWSRRFNGLKLFLPLAIHGWENYQRKIDGQVEIGNYLREKLRQHGWEIANQSELPVVCFTHPSLRKAEALKTFAEQVLASGKAWFSIYPINGEATIRACITNFATTASDIDAFVSLLEQYLPQLEA